MPISQHNRLKEELKRQLKDQAFGQLGKNTKVIIADMDLYLVLDYISRDAIKHQLIADYQV